MIWNPFSIMELSSLSEAEMTSRNGTMQNIARMVSVTYPMMERVILSISACLRTFFISPFTVVELIKLPPLFRIEHGLYRICERRNWRT
ncbi:hypothetical protein D3C80_1630140 [compost metagenome]